MNNIVMYLLVNSNLSMGKGKIAAQVGHAVGLYVDRVYKTGYDKEKYDFWMDNELTKIVLKCSEEIMLTLMDDNNVVKVIDKGYTQIAPNSLTVMCLGVNDVDKFKEKYPFISELKLL